MAEIIMISILKRHQIFFISCGFFIITCIFFSPVFLEGKVPFPANLLVSTYGPWKYSPDPEYPNGPPNKPMGFDNLRQIFPYKTINKEFTTLDPQIQYIDLPFDTPVPVVPSTPFL